jgi:DUF4097 and DUF4098 domain-containing protein YvlB
VSGDLTLADGRVDRLDAKTVSGRITADIDLDCAGSLHVRTASGTVAIRLPGKTSTQVDLRSAAGRVQSEFAGLSPGRQPGGNALTGQLGSGGSSRVSVTTMSGQVTLLQRDDPRAPQPASATGGSR